MSDKKAKAKEIGRWVLFWLMLPFIAVYLIILYITTKISEWIEDNFGGF